MNTPFTLCLIHFMWFYFLYLVHTLEVVVQAKSPLILLYLKQRACLYNKINRHDYTIKVLQNHDT